MLALPRHTRDLHTPTIHVSVQVRYSSVAFACVHRYIMGRKQGGIGRPGNKHKKPAKFDIHRQLKADNDVPQPKKPRANEESAKEAPAEVPQAADAASAALPAAPAAEPAVSASRPITYVPRPHPRYDDDEPFLPGFRGGDGAYGSEMWDPDKPPCVPSDERPANIFGSEEAAYATAAANTLEHLLTEQESGEEEEEEDEEEREQDIKKARVFYEHSLRRLAREFPDLQVPVTQLVAGLHAREQCTRPCPCGVGDIPRWPWVLSTSSLGFCPEAQTGPEPWQTCGRHRWEFICWRGEWIRAWPGGDRIAW